MNPSTVELHTIDIQLFEAIPGNSILLLPDTPHFTIVAATEDYVRTAGKRREALVGKRLFEVFPKSADEMGEESEQISRQSLLQVLTKKEPDRLPVYRYDITNPDGSFGERYWSIVNKPVVNDKGEVVYIIHTAEDRTDQVKAKERQGEHQALERAYQKIEESQLELQEAHHRIIDILESTTDAFYALDASFNFTYVNKRAAQLWQRDRDSLIGKHYWTEFNKAVGSKSYQMHQLALQEGKPVYYETVSPLLGIWIDASIYPGTNGSLSVFFRDITERKAAEERLRESEARYRSLFQSIDQGFCLVELIYDENGKPVDHLFLEINPTYEAQTGLKDVVGKTARQVAPDIEPYWFEMYDRAVRTGKGVRFAEESKALNRWFDVFAYPSGGMDSRKVAVLFADITDRKKAEVLLREHEALLQKMVEERTAELQAKNKELQRSNKELEGFAYAASHDMKEPIRKIHFFADRLKSRLKGKLEDEDRRYFERLENGAKRMSTLIDDLLVYSHVSRGMSSEEMVDLNQTLSFVLDDLELHIEEKGARIEVGVLPTIRGHQRQLQQLFENLIGNALKYSKSDAASRIKITSKMVNGSNIADDILAIPKNKSYHHITVQDNGIGFEQRDADRIFNVFTRLHGNTEYKGTGVGLSIARKVVENHHGYIWAESKPGEGAAFNVLLPAG